MIRIAAASLALSLKVMAALATKVPHARAGVPSILRVAAAASGSGRPITLIRSPAAQPRISGFVASSLQSGGLSSLPLLPQTARILMQMMLTRGTVTAHASAKTATPWDPWRAPANVNPIYVLIRIPPWITDVNSAAVHRAGCLDSISRQVAVRKSLTGGGRHPRGMWLASKYTASRNGPRQFPGPGVLQNGGVNVSETKVCE